MAEANKEVTNNDGTTALSIDKERSSSRQRRRRRRSEPPSIESSRQSAYLNLDKVAIVVDNYTSKYFIVVHNMQFDQPPSYLCSQSYPDGLGSCADESAKAVR